MNRDPALVNVPKIGADVTSTGTQTLTNKTLTSPTVVQGTLGNVTLGSYNDLNCIIKSVKEPVNLVNSSPGTAVDFLYMPITASGTQIWYYTVNTTSNFSLALYGSPNFTTRLSVGESITFVLIVKNGATGYYMNSFTFDQGSWTTTTLWQNGSAPSFGNANAHDVYTFNIVRTGTSSFTIFASQVRFA